MENRKVLKIGQKVKLKDDTNDMIELKMKVRNTDTPKNLSLNKEYIIT